MINCEVITILHHPKYNNTHQLAGPIRLKYCRTNTFLDVMYENVMSYLGHYVAFISSSNAVKL